ncbi:glutathione S-transferase family protein [Vineibacter terrae]|uniref:glutathione S-transferase family protein n=1 Tax=Vineibacter terrae TaxID=2586908 RepID=UPI002E354447|nr:glutathione S-transferase family protein [Vineibacter terrae]HEX2886858.1 glutathione S-transferase family protein [Vineibacter terrae]
MSLTLHCHPLAAFAQKVLIALYENGTPFKPHIVDLGDPAANAAFKRLWPIGKMPVLRDDVRDRTIPESSIIIEYLAQHYPGATALLPADPDLALATRLRDRFYDHYVAYPMQRIVADRLRPPDGRDPIGVAEAQAQLRTAYDVIDQQTADSTWAMGDMFTMADCAALPALYYANEVLPFRSSHRHAASYLDRLTQRPAVARVLAEAEPYRHLFPR